MLAVAARHVDEALLAEWLRERVSFTDCADQPTRTGCSAACDECDHDVGGVTVEVLSASIVDPGGTRVGVSRSDLHVA